MREAIGDCWTYAEKQAADALCVLTNMTTRLVDGEPHLVMGAGQAKQAAERYPELPRLWGSYYSERMGRGTNILWTPKESVYHRLGQPGQRGGRLYRNSYALVSFPTKDDVSQDSKLSLIERACREMLMVIDDSRCVVLPRPGCGLGGLRWVDVKPVLADILDSRFVVITFPEGS